VGVVTEAVPLPRIGGQAKLTLKFTDLVLPSGSTVPIHASFIQTGRSETGRDAATVGGAAAGGAILGRILNKGSRSKGAVIGAIIGAVAGTAIASRTPGEEVVFPEGSVVGLRLNDAIEVRARARR
jgi:outer membrane lipoprotein SlyB